MAQSIKNVFRDQTSHYTWIDDQTRRKINEKVWQKLTEITITFYKIPFWVGIYIIFEVELRAYCVCALEGLFLGGIYVILKEAYYSYFTVPCWINQLYLQEEAMKYKIGFPKLCANETLLNKYYEDVSPPLLH